MIILRRLLHHVFSHFTHPHNIMLFTFFSSHLTIATTIIFSDITDYIFYNQTVTFSGNYSVGDTECVVAPTYAAADNEVEGTEFIRVEVNVSRNLTERVRIFIIDNDCKLSSSYGFMTHQRFSYIICSFWMQI